MTAIIFFVLFLKKAKLVMKRGQEVIQMGEVEKRKEQKIIYMIDVLMKYSRSL